jgi:hypothetical protein
MSAMTRRLRASMVVGVLMLAGVAACGGSETPTASPTTPSTPSTTMTPSPTPSSAPESQLTGPTVVVVRELSDGSRVLVAYDLDDGTARQLTTLEGDCHPTVDATGTSVVVAHITTPDGASCVRGAYVDSVGTSHLVLIDLATGDRQVLTEQREGVMDLWPAWNRAGDGWVYFKRRDSVAHTTGLWRVDPSTGEVQEVLSGEGMYWAHFAVEPGGRSIWVSLQPCQFDEAIPCDESSVNEAAAPAQFTRLDLTTGSISLHPFDNGGSGSIYDVAWTPDGGWFAYARKEGLYPYTARLLITRWPDGTPRTLLTMPPDEGATTAWHQLNQVGWHPDASVVVLQDMVLSKKTAEPSSFQVPEERILVVDTANSSAFPIGPASVRDLSFDVWAPPATS